MYSWSIYEYNSIHSVPYFAIAEKKVMMLTQSALNEKENESKERNNQARRFMSARKYDDRWKWKCDISDM